MEIIFDIVANALKFIAMKTGLSYMEINIIVYYFIIPFSYIVLLDIYFKKHYLKILFALCSIVFILTIRNFKDFSIWLFEKSANFLNAFNFLGIDYTFASVIICVIVVIIIYAILIRMIIIKDKKAKIG